MVSVVQTWKEDKGLAYEFWVLRHRLHYLYDKLRSTYKGDGKCGIDTQND
jgi:hypothetical protein